MDARTLCGRCPHGGRLRAPRGGRGQALSVRREASGRFFVEIGRPRLVYRLLPLFPLPFIAWMEGCRRGGGGRRHFRPSRPHDEWKGD